MLFASISWSLSRETRSARVEISELVRGLNFFPPHQHPYFCITAVLGIVPDILYQESKAAYAPPDWFDGMYAPVHEAGIPSFYNYATSGCTNYAGLTCAIGKSIA